MEVVLARPVAMDLDQVQEELVELDHLLPGFHHHMEHLDLHLVDILPVEEEVVVEPLLDLAVLVVAVLVVAVHQCLRVQMDQIILVVEEVVLHLEIHQLLEIPVLVVLVVPE